MSGSDEDSFVCGGQKIIRRVARGRGSPAAEARREASSGDEAGLCGYPDPCGAGIVEAKKMKPLGSCALMVKQLCAADTFN
jgi:hypothetical protein